MASILRVPVVWNGLGNLPGVSVFFWDGGVSSVVTDITDFFDDIKGLFPNGLSWTIPSSGDSLDDFTGAIDGFWSTTGGGTINATGGTLGYAAGTGARVRWRTGGIRNGRRVVGSTFLCPLHQQAYESNGTITSTALSTIQGAADLLVASGALLIWSRPTPGGGSDGFSSAATAAQVPDRVTSLRSRRY